MGKVVELDANELEVIASATPEAVQANRRCASVTRSLRPPVSFASYQFSSVYTCSDLLAIHLNYLQSCISGSTIFHILPCFVT